MNSLVGLQALKKAKFLATSATRKVFFILVGSLLVHNEITFLIKLPTTDRAIYLKVTHENIIGMSLFIVQLELMAVIELSQA